MSKRIIEMWICPYCGDSYRDESDAEDCARECFLELIDPDDVMEEDIIEYFCKYCEKVHGLESYADKCERFHEESQDMKYGAYIAKMERIKLSEASGHPKQVKLT